MSSSNVSFFSLNMVHVMRSASKLLGSFVLQTLQLEPHGQHCGRLAHKTVMLHTLNIPISSRIFLNIGLVLFLSLCI